MFMELMDKYAHCLYLNNKNPEISGSVLLKLSKIRTASAEYGEIPEIFAFPFPER